MKPSTAAKLGAIVDNWRYGNHSDARTAIKKLNRAELVEMLTLHHQFTSAFIGERALLIAFEDFVLHTLRN